MPTITTATQNVTALAASLANVAATTELRGTSTTLYTKGRVTDITLNQAERAQRQAQARALISRAVDEQFPSGEMLPIYAGAVKKNMASVFEGRGAVTKADVARVAREAQRVDGIRLAFKSGQNARGLEDNAVYQAAQRNWREVLAGIPDAPTDHFGAMERYVQLLNLGRPSDLGADQLREMGALKGMMDKLKDDHVLGLTDVAALERATRALEVAVDCGATSAKVLPQAVALNRIGSTEDRRGRCMPLVVLACVAEDSSPHGADGLMRRLEQETHALARRDERGPTSYAKSVAHLHGDRVLSDNMRPALPSKTGHRDVIGRLAEGGARPGFLTLEVPQHVMMVGVTRNGDKDSWVFYDPNFGLARFEEPKQLLEYLDRYLGDDLGYGKRYLMEEGARGFEIDNVKSLNYDALGKAEFESEGVRVEVRSLIGVVDDAPR